MGETRAFSAEFAQEVSDLYLRSMRGQNRKAPESLTRYFCEIFLNNPWVTEEVPSWMYLDEGKVRGFCGVIPRPMQYKGKPIRAAILAQFYVEHAPYKGPAAFEIFKRLYAGPQEFTFTDGAGEGASRIMVTAGGQVARVYAFQWVRMLRPLESGREMFDRFAGAKLGWVKSAAGLVTKPLDALIAKTPLGFGPPPSAYSARAATAQELMECIQDFKGREPLRPAYRMPEFGWLMEQMEKTKGHGDLRIRTVFDGAGERCGSFVYYAKQGGAAYLIQVGWRRKDNFTEVFRAMLQDAWREGCTGVKGQAIPQFLVTLSEHQCIFRQMNSCVVGYSRDKELLNAFLLGETGMSRLDGECWLQFPLNDWRS